MSVWSLKSLDLKRRELSREKLRKKWYIRGRKNSVSGLLSLIMNPLAIAMIFHPADIFSLDRYDFRLGLAWFQTSQALRYAWLKYAANSGYDLVLPIDPGECLDKWKAQASL